MIAGIVPNSFIDYPSHLSAVICTQGCNFNCFYCHNRELISRKKGLLSIEDVIEFLGKREGFLDGVVVSGGEPTMHKELVNLFIALRKVPFDIKLDTNGSNPTMVEELVEKKLVDYVALDIKSTKSRYSQITACANRAGEVFRTLTMLSESHIPYELRTTLAPTIEMEDLIQIAHEIPIDSLWKLQWYKIPEYYLPQDRERIHDSHFTIEKEEMLLRVLKKIHPKIVIG